MYHPIQHKYNSTVELTSISKSLLELLYQLDYFTGIESVLVNDSNRLQNNFQHAHMYHAALSVAFASCPTM